MDVATTEPDPSRFSSLTASPPLQKRKRSIPDSPSEPRRTKRSSATMPSPEPHVGVEAFIESALDTAQAAAAGVNVSDFNALQQAAAGEHSDAADPANASSTAAAALVYPTIHVPQTTEETFEAQLSLEQEHQPDMSYAADMTRVAQEMAQNEGLSMDTAIASHPSHSVMQQTNGMHQEQRYTSSNSNPKPAVGSEEWHKMRKDNHKEVERRRRETINEGINELAKIVPGCEKNKGSILQRAVSFITQLKENEQQNIEKWTLEKLLTEQAIAELSSSNDKLKSELDRAWQEVDTWKQIAQNAGASDDNGKPNPGEGN